MIGHYQLTLIYFCNFFFALGISLYICNQPVSMQNSALHKLRKEAIYIDGKDRTDEIESYSFEGNKCVLVYKSSGKAYSYPQHRIKMVRSAIQSERAGNIFSYLKAIAESIGLKTEEGYNILANSYGRISFIPDTSILYNFLNGKEPEIFINIDLNS